MSSKLFTSEEIEELSKSPHVKTVTKRSVIFEDSFKEMARIEYSQGKSGRQIFMQHGIDPNVLGEIRIHGFLERLENCTDKTCLENAKKETKKDLAVIKSQEKRIKELEYRVEYLTQENEFLKKIQEARKTQTKRTSNTKLSEHV